MKPKKLIYIKESKDYAAGWISPRRVKNAIARGEQIKVNDSNKKLLNEIKKEVKQTKQSPFFSTESNEPPPRQKNTKEVKQSFAQGKRVHEILTAPPVIINQSAINELRKKVRKPDGTYFKREYYEEMERARAAEKSKIDDYLKTLDKKYNAIVIKEVTEDILFFQTGNFVELIQDGGNEMKVGATVTVIDFEGNGGDEPHTSISLALSHIAALNAQINEVIKQFQKEHTAQEMKGGAEKGKIKPLQIYVLIPETIKSNSNGFVLSVKYDYENYSVIGDISYDQFDYVLNDR